MTSRQSLFLFVVHRGGSIFLHDKLAAPLARDLNLMCADLGTYLFKYPPSKASPYLASPRGRFYSKIYVPLFPFIRVPRGCRAACVIRDPRDVAVSTYYSLAYSHPLLPGESLENRVARQTRMREMGLARWLQQEGLPVAGMELRAALKLAKGTQTHLFKYEDMVTRWGYFLRGILNWLRVPGKFATKYLPLAAEFESKGEGILSHKRQVAPGNWKTVLTPDLVRLGEEVFGSHLLEAGYHWD